MATSFTPFAERAGLGYSLQPSDQGCADEYPNYQHLLCSSGSTRCCDFIEWAGVNDSSWKGLLVFSLAMVVAIIAWCVASPFTIRHARMVQRIGQALVGPLDGVRGTGGPRTQYTEQEISPHFWLNGTLPDSDEFNALVKGGFTKLQASRERAWSKIRKSSPTRRSRRCQNTRRLPNISAFRDGRASQSGPVFACATSWRS